MNDQARYYEIFSVCTEGMWGGFLGLFGRHSCVLQIMFKSVSLAFLTFFSAFNITETSIQINFDSETHNLLS